MKFPRYMFVSFFLLWSISLVWALELWYKQVDMKLDGSKVSEAMSSVGNIEVDFCNKPWEKAISYTLAPWEIQKICYVLSNYSYQDLDVHVGFVDGTVTNDQWKNKACKQQWEVLDFGQYVTGYQEVVHVPSSWEVQYFASLQFPIGFTGVHNWCLVYYLGEVGAWWGMNFTVLMRRAKFIDVNIQNSVPEDEGQTLRTTDHFLWILLAILVVWLVIRKKLTIKKTRE